MDLIELPKEKGKETPLYFGCNDGLWFFSKEDGDYDWKVETALIATCIGEKRCPTPSEWASFSIAGTIVAYLSGKYIVPPVWDEDLEFRVWEIFFPLVSQNKEFDKKFTASLLRIFIPRRHYAPPERPYYKNNFRYYWTAMECSDTQFHSVSNLRIEVIRKGVDIMKRISPNIASYIENIAEYSPEMLDLAIERIRSTYHW